jgi:hypothetical protein
MTMSTYDDVDREARTDWFEARADMPDERPTAAELEDIRAEQAGEAAELAAVRGGCDEPVSLGHDHEEEAF